MKRIEKYKLEVLVNICYNSIHFERSFKTYESFKVIPK